MSQVAGWVSKGFHHCVGDCVYASLADSHQKEQKWFRVWRRERRTWLLSDDPREAVLSLFVAHMGRDTGIYTPYLVRSRFTIESPISSKKAIVQTASHYYQGHSCGISFLQIKTYEHRLEYYQLDCHDPTRQQYIYFQVMISGFCKYILLKIVTCIETLFDTINEPY